MPCHIVAEQTQERSHKTAHTRRYDVGESNTEGPAAGIEELQGIMHHSKQRRVAE